MKDFFRRAGWMLLVVLFVATGLGIGVYGFLQAIKQDKAPEQNAAELLSTDQRRGGKLNGFPPVAKIEQLSTSDLKEGTGAEVKVDSTITVEYTGALAATGVIFDSTADHGNQPFTTKLDGVIEGWKGLVGAKAGGVRRLLIPAAQAYGANSPSADIPPNSDMVFDVTLLDVK